MSLPLQLLGNLTGAGGTQATGFSQALQFGSWAGQGVAQANSPQATQALTNAWQAEFNQSLGNKDAAPLTLQASAQKIMHLPVGGQGGSVADLANGFGQALSQQMTELNTLQTQADEATQDFAAGKDIPLHQVMIAMNKADMSMQLAMQVRNKVLSAYQEISRMPV
jgi:flagellar hook-basal body complex protein FliE